ncbi:MAG: IPT/TIG domain-containing protein, partial [Bacteroidota bacterium]
MNSNLYPNSFYGFKQSASGMLLRLFLFLVLVLTGTAVVSAAPVISSFSPNQGVPGSLVSIRGTGFTNTISVRFNGVNSSFTTTGDTLITATVPNDTASGVIVVQTLNGTTLTPGSFTVIFNAPRIDSFTPVSGGWGTPVTVKGKYFLGTNIFKIGSINCSFNVLNDSTITLNIPSFASTAVFYITARNISTISNSSFNVLPAQPNITRFTPIIGPEGTVVTIYGPNVGHATQVYFYNGRASSFSVVNDTTITAIVPAFATTGVITVYSSSLLSVSPGSFVVGYPAPVITSYSPGAGSAGTVVTLRGHHFTGLNQVLFNGAVAGFTVTGDSLIMATVPSNASTGVISVRTPGGTVVTGGNFVVIPVAPDIVSFSPVQGPVGTNVTLHGHFFLGSTIVRFNGVVSSFSVVDDTTIIATVPSGATTGIISVTARGLTAITAGSFLVKPPNPTITSFLPVSGSSNTTVTIKGHNFTNATAVRFNGAVASYVVVNDSVITAVVPLNATTGVINIVVANITATSPGSFTVLPALARIKSFTPATGYVLSTVIIKGDHFTGTLVVRFNGTAGAFSVISDSVISVTVPIGATNGVITVTTSVNTAQSASTFVVKPTPPQILGFDPMSGPPGQAVTLAGHFFTGTTIVRLNGVVCSFSLLSDSVITCIVPSTTTGLFTVTAGALTGTSTSTFTVIPNVPSITSFDPQSGNYGATVTIRGVRLTNTSIVRFNGTIASFTVSGDTLITALVPVGATTGVISVVVGANTIISPGSFTVIPTSPIITSFTPVSGVIGSTVMVYGRNFTGTTLVRFNGVTATFSLLNDTSIRAVVPLGATTGILTVTANGYTGISQGTFQVIPVDPSIKFFTPTIGQPGTVVTIHGTLLTGTTAVRFNGTISAFTFIKDTLITAIVPAGSSTGVITVTANGVNAVSSSNFIVLPVSPVITDFSPTIGSEGTVVQIRGSHFTGTTLVRFNATAATYTVYGDTLIIATVQPGSTTGVISVTA